MPKLGSNLKRFHTFRDLATTLLETCGLHVSERDYDGWVCERKLIVGCPAAGMIDTQHLTVAF